MCRFVDLEICRWGLLENGEILTLKITKPAHYQITKSSNWLFLLFKLHFMEQVVESLPF